MAAMELLTAYRKNKSKLQYIVDWLNENRNENGKWDMGATVNDHIYFPLSDDWRNKGLREGDCTYRVQNFIDMVTGAV